MQWQKNMFDVRSYRASLVFAVSLHLVIVSFLLIKFNTTKSAIGFSRSNRNFINALAINEKDFDDMLNINKTTISNKPVPKQESVKTQMPKAEKAVTPTATIKKAPIKKEKLQTALHKSMLAEQARELADLKKDRAQAKKKLAKKTQRAMQNMLQDQITSEQKQLADDQAEAHGHMLQGEVDKHTAMIIQSIASQWIVPDGVEAGLECKLLINLAPGGVVMDVRLVKTSGNQALDRSAQAAIMKSSPLPVPEDNQLFDRFRTISLTFSPEGIIGN